MHFKVFKDFSCLIITEIISKTCILFSWSCKEHFKARCFFLLPVYWFILFYRYCGTYKITESSSKCTNTTQENHSWANVLKINAEVCAECQPFAMHKHFGMRCKGHGVPGKVTRWRAIDVPHCSGKWELKTIDRACTCNVHQNKDFIFI